MRAAVFVKPGQPLEIQHIADPEPLANEVVLRVERCGICGSDLHMTEEQPYAFASGFVPGHECATEVVAVGRGVDHLKVGDHVVPHSMTGCGTCKECLAGSPFFCRQAVMCAGGYAEYMTSPAFSCVRLPKTLSLIDAAIVEPMAVSLMGININPFPVGARVAVLGVGPIGLAAIFWAKRAGAGHIVAMAASRRREHLAKHMGADDFLVIGDSIAGEVAEKSGGAPDVVLECVGVPGMIEKSVDIVKPRGSITVLGFCLHNDPWVPANAVFKEVKLQFAASTNLREFVQSADALDAGLVEPLSMVTDTVSLDEFPDMFEALRERSNQCKVLLNPWQ